MTVLQFPPVEDREAEAYLGLNWTWRARWSEEFECYLVSIDEVPDYFAAGVTEAEAWANSRDAFIALVKAYRAQGVGFPAPEPATPPHEYRVVRFG